MYELSAFSGQFSVFCRISGKNYKKIYFIMPYQIFYYEPGMQINRPYRLTAEG